MRHLVVLGSLAIALALCGAAMAQENSGSNVLGTVTRGNTTIVFEASGTRDLPIKQMQDWQQFAQDHPAIARDLSRHPGLVKSDAWVNRHKALAQFFQDHPGMREAMRSDPGNYVAPAGPANG